LINQAVCGEISTTHAVVRYVSSGFRFRQPSYFRPRGADRSAVTIGIVNPNPEAKSFELNVAGAELATEGKSWVIAGDDPALFNEAGQERLKIVEQTFRRDGRIQVPPLSVTVVRLQTANNP
jgi:hypothetical protein